MFVFIYVNRREQVPEALAGLNSSCSRFLVCVNISISAPACGTVFKDYRPPV